MWNFHHVMVWKYYKIRYKLRGNNSEEPSNLCTGNVWLIWKLSHTNNIENRPGYDHCVPWGWLNQVNCVTDAVCVLCLKPLLACFIKHIFRRFSFSITDQGWLLRVSPSICNLYPICTWLCFSSFGNDGWNFLCILFKSFFSVLIFNFSEDHFHLLLWEASWDKACFEMLDILFSVNLKFIVTK